LYTSFSLWWPFSYLCWVDVNVCNKGIHALLPPAVGYTCARTCMWPLSVFIYPSPIAAYAHRYL
jgi:hypothetical protein